MRRSLLCTAIAMCTVGSAHAVTFTLSPQDTTVGPGEEVVLRLVADAASDIKGVSLVWGYTAPRLGFLSAHAGGVIAQPGGFTEFVNLDAVPPADSVGYDAVVLSGTGSGPGVVVFLRFTANSLGNASVNCLFADVRDSQNTPTQPSCSSTTIHVVGPVPTHTTRWSSLKRKYR